MKLKIKLLVRNRHGLHARPAMEIVKLLQNCKSEVSFTLGKVTINAKSIMGILSLAATRNSDILATIEGEDASETEKKLIGAFSGELGE